MGPVLSGQGFSQGLFWCGGASYSVAYWRNHSRSRRSIRAHAAELQVGRFPFHLALTGRHTARAAVRRAGLDVAAKGGAGQGVVRPLTRRVLPSTRCWLGPGRPGAIAATHGLTRPDAGQAGTLPLGQLAFATPTIVLPPACALQNTIIVGGHMKAPSLATTGASSIFAIATLLLMMPAPAQAEGQDTAAYVSRSLRCDGFDDNRCFRFADPRRRGKPYLQPRTHHHHHNHVRPRDTLRRRAAVAGPRPRP